jgi:hypothetical protein
MLFGHVGKKDQGKFILRSTVSQALQNNGSARFLEQLSSLIVRYLKIGPQVLSGIRGTNQPRNGAIKITPYALKKSFR